MSGNTFNEATFFELNSLVSDSVGFLGEDGLLGELFDSNDYWAFSLPQNSIFELVFTNTLEDFGVEIYNASRNLIPPDNFIIEDSIDPDTDISKKEITGQLNAGIYYIRVFPIFGDTLYSFTTDVTSANPDGAGNTAETARLISVTSEVSSFSDSVGTTDPNDFYRFTLNDSSELELNLTGLSQSDQLLVSLGLYDELTNPIDFTFSDNSNNLRINAELEVGTYYIEVLATLGSTDYQLSVSAISNETSEPPTSEPPTSEPPTTTPTPLSLLDTQFYRFSNRQVGGTYLFASEGESVNIRQNFSNVFSEDGPAFRVATQEGDNLLRFNRFANTQVEGTYLFATEGESVSIRQNFGNIFREEGIAFYAYGADANVGTDYYRLANTQIQGTYLFVNKQERDSALAQFPNLFRDEGIAFEVG